MNDIPFRVTCETQAGHQDAVVIVGDAFFVQAGLLLARQLLEKEAGGFDVVVLCSEPLELPEALSAGLRMGLVEVGNRDLVAVDERIRIEAYVRIFLPYLLPEYRRICYLDADMYLKRPGLAALFDMDMQGHALAAVRDVPLWMAQSRGRPMPLKPGEIVQAPEDYFNSGLLLIDSARYRDLMPAADILSYLQAHGSALPMHDQSFLNTHFSHRYRHLPPIYNFPMVEEYLPVAEEADPVILHFVGAGKPWYPPDDPVRVPYNQEYVAFLSQHFGFEERANVHEVQALREGRSKAHYKGLHAFFSRLNKRRNLKRKRRFARQAWQQQMALFE